MTDTTAVVQRPRRFGDDLRAFWFWAGVTARAFVVALAILGLASLWLHSRHRLLREVVRDVVECEIAAARSARW